MQLLRPFILLSFVESSTSSSDSSFLSLPAEVLLLRPDVQAKSSCRDTLRREYLRRAFVSHRQVLSASCTSLLDLIPIKCSTGLPGVKSLLAFSSFVVDCFADDFPRIQSLGPAAGSLYPVVGFGSYSAPARPPRRSGRNRCRES